MDTVWSIINSMYNWGANDFCFLVITACIIIITSWQDFDGHDINIHCNVRMSGVLLE